MPATSPNRSRGARRPSADGYVVRASGAVEEAGSSYRLVAVTSAGVPTTATAYFRLQVEREGSFGSALASLRIRRPADGNPAPPDSQSLLLCIGFRDGSANVKDQPAALHRLGDRAASVVDGNSPNGDLYSPANRPNCQKPYRVAISVTVVLVGTLSRRPRRTRCIRRNNRYRLGLTPSCSWQHTRKVRSDAPIAVQSSGIKSALS
jgi:hypothetical protein